MIAIYIRVSSEGQVKDGYSLESQKDRLMRYCDVNEIDNYKIYVEDGKSAKNDKRPVYQEMLRDIKSGKLKGVLVNRLDRIMRSIGDLHNLLILLDKHDCTFASATEAFDTKSATGRFFVYVIGALAQWENDLKSERIIEVLEDKVANEGIWIGNVPYPFNINDDNKLEADPIRSKLTLDMIDKLLSGMSTNKIAEYMNTIETTKKTWRANTVLRIFKNHALYGATSWKDKIYENTHEGIITKEKYHKIQKILSDRSLHRRRDVKNNYLFQSKLLCPNCDNVMGVQRHFRKRKDGSEFQGATYRCNYCISKKISVRSPSETNVLSGLYRYMRDLKFETMEIDENESETENEIYKKQLLAIEEKRKKYQRAWASDLMTDDEFKELMNETKKAYDDIKSKLSDQDEPISIEDNERIIRDFNSNFKALTTEEKQNFVSRFIRRIRFTTVDRPPKNKGFKTGGYNVVINDVEFY